LARGHRMTITMIRALAALRPWLGDIA